MKLNSKNVQLIFETSQFHAKWTINHENFIRSKSSEKNPFRWQILWKESHCSFGKKYLLALAHEQWIGIRQYHTRHFCLQTIGYSMNVSALRLAGPIVIASNPDYQPEKNQAYTFLIFCRDFFCEFFLAFTKIFIELSYLLWMRKFWAHCFLPRQIHCSQVFAEFWIDITFFFTQKMIIKCNVNTTLMNTLNDIFPIDRFDCYRTLILLL